jgi:hypothetical protein
VSEIERLERRKQQLLKVTAEQRHELSEDLEEVARAANRVDGWLAVARRVTPFVAAGLAVAAVIAGPSRVLRLVRGAFVPALLAREVLVGRLPRVGRLLGRR